MAHKSQVRQKIEKILGEMYDQAYIDPMNKAKTNYRMKLYALRNPLTQLRVMQIRKLPHVTQVKYLPMFDVISGESYFVRNTPGVCIYFDCRPSQIKL